MKSTFSSNKALKTTNYVYNMEFKVLLLRFTLK